MQMKWNVFLYKALLNFDNRKGIWCEMGKGNTCVYWINLQMTGFLLKFYCVVYDKY
jgi:hypothetical protein